MNIYYYICVYIYNLFIYLSVCMYIYMYLFPNHLRVSYRHDAPLHLNITPNSVYLLENKGVHSQSCS